MRVLVLFVRIDYPTGSFIEYSYDDNGNRTQVKTPNQQVNYTFDELNRLATVDNGSGTTTYTYDEVGNRATQVNANGTTATYSYDQLNRLTDLVHTDSSNTTLASYQYELGANGNRLSLTEATGRVVEYTYDNLYRLVTETVTDPINGNHNSQWSYDAVGNRLQQNIDGTITTYVYNNNDHLLSETENSITTTYVYDANGNTLTKSIDSTVDTSYSYSKDNRMLTADTTTSNISYSYDAGGIRQSQTVDGQVTHFLVDPNRSYHQVLEEQDNLFLPQVTYTYGDDLISQTNSQGTHTFGYDGLGSTRILTDTSGAVQNSYGYQAFGELDYQHGTLENNYLYTGEQYDNNVGFYYLRARYYNPSIGRFQNMDTFPGMQFEPVTLHKYLYTHADPINGIDPSGNVTLGQVMTALAVANILYTMPDVGRNIADVFSGNQSVGEAGISILLAFTGGKFMKALNKVCKTKRNKTCRMAIGWAAAQLKLQTLLKTTTSTKAKEKYYVVASAAFDEKTSKAYASFNLGDRIRPSTAGALRSHVKDIGYDDVGCSQPSGMPSRMRTSNILGNCAEFLAVNKLMKGGSKLKNINVIEAYNVDTSGWLTGRGGIKPYCGNCKFIFGIRNKKR